MLYPHALKPNLDGWRWQCKFFFFSPDLEMIN